jgi:mannose-6-phosphate isomerase-like protein (cupin superfamily)
MLTSVVAALAFESSSRVAHAQPGKQALVVPAGEDRFRAITINPCKLSGKDTNGALAIFGGKRKGLSAGVPLHVHHYQDEWWYIIEGQYIFQIGDRKIRAKAGDAVFGPRGVPHSPRLLSETGMNLTVFQPAGTIEEFFQENAEARRKNEEGSPEREAAQFRAHGMEIVGPAVEP